MKFLIKRLLLIIIGIFLSLLLLEFGLRVVGWTISSYQQYKNNKVLRNKSQYTIMCLGESTTAGQYPIQLQQILNKKYPNKFSVIDCGIAGTNLETILDLLDGNMNKYNPDISICMMGVGNNLIVSNDNVEFVKKSKMINLRIYRLYLLLKTHLKHLIKKHYLFAFDNDEQENYKKQLYFAIKTYSDGKYKQATDSFNNLLEKDLSNYQNIKETAYTYLVLIHSCFFENINEQEMGYEMAINAIKNNYYDKENYYSAALRFLIDNKKPIDKLKLLFMRDSFIPSCNLYKKFEPYLSYNDKKEILNKIMNSDSCTRAFFYCAMKDFEKANKIFAERDNFRLNFPNIETYNLYKLIIKKLIDNNIKVICMQYPIRSIKPLQEQLKNEPYYDKVNFISNEKLFKNALMKKNYDEIFKDQFAGDFGHCTDLGNTMIAKNIVNSLEKMLNLKQQKL